MPSVQRFLIKEGANAGKTVELARFPFMIGRARDCDYVLDYTAISRLHARCTSDHQSIYLEDSGSTNGTFVNGRRLAPGEQYRLRAGDEVTFGQVCVWVFDDPATTAQIAAVKLPRPGLEIDEAAARVMVGGTLLYPPLSPNQFALLALLAANAGRIVTRDEVISAVWGADTGISDQTIDALVSRLRRRLLEADPEHDYIITRRGFGFMFQDR
jgi:DNA-binding response OmpR family regulator